MKRYKADKYDRHGNQRNNKASKQAKRQQARKQTKGGVHEGQM